MPALFGMFAPDEGQISADDFASMETKLRHRRVDPASTSRVCDRSVAFGAIAENAVSALVHGPDRSAVFAGRLDNAGEFGAGLSDTCALMAAYQRWGAGCCERLLGDFCFAIWDRDAGSLLCARDVFGIKPFYYSHRRGVFRFASEIGPLVGGPDGDRSINEGMVAEYLACGITSATETLFAAVSRLPPAHALLINRGGLRVWRYWTPAIDRSRQEKPLETEVARFRDLLSDAVTVRMRGADRVGITLSGGIDSSAIAATAAAGRRLAPAAQVAAFSLSFPGRSCDERRFAEAAAHAAGIDVHFEPARVPAPAEARRYAGLFDDFPGYPNTIMFDTLRQAAAVRGYRVLLTGEGGDDWFAGSYYHYADLLRARRWRDLVRQYRADRALAREQAIALPRFALLRLGLWPLLSVGMRRVLRPWLEGRRAVPWLSAPFARRVDLAGRTGRGDLNGNDGVAQAHQLTAAASGVDAHYFEIAERSAALFGIEERHPFYDRRLVEFALSLREDHRWSGRENKRVIREAMRGVLPEPVRTRTAKAHFSFVYAELLEALNRTTGARDPLAAWIDAAALARTRAKMFRFYRGGDERYTKYIWPLWMAAGIELWLAADRGAAADHLRGNEHEWAARRA